MSEGEGKRRLKKRKTEKRVVEVENTEGGQGYALIIFLSKICIEIRVGAEQHIRLRRGARCRGLHRPVSENTYKGVCDKVCDSVCVCVCVCDGMWCGCTRERKHFSLTMT